MVTGPDKRGINVGQLAIQRPVASAAGGRIFGHLDNCANSGERGRHVRTLVSDIRMRHSSSVASSS